MSLFILAPLYLVLTAFVILTVDFMVGHVFRTDDTSGQPDDLPLARFFRKR